MFGCSAAFFGLHLCACMWFLSLICWTLWCRKALRDSSPCITTLYQSCQQICEALWSYNFEALWLMQTVKPWSPWSTSDCQTARSLFLWNRMSSRSCWLIIWSSLAAPACSLFTLIAELFLCFLNFKRMSETELDVCSVMDSALLPP